MKILILKNKGVTKKYIKENTDLLTKYYTDKFVKKGWIKPLSFDFTIQDIDVKLEMVKYGKNTQGIEAYASSNGKEYAKTVTPRMTYNAVILFHAEKFKIAKAYVTAVTTHEGVFPETEYIEIPYTTTKNTVVHEFMHAIGNILEKLGLVKKEDDQMDKTLVDGKWVSYHKNNYPTADGGNYDMTFRAFAPHLDKLDGLLKKKSVVNSIIETIKETIAPTPEDPFNKFIEHIFKWEGGYVNNPKDPGGETKYGISKRAYPREDIKNLTKERATQLYKQDYWLASSCDKLPFFVACMVMDTSVNMGVKTSIKLLQSSVGVKADGIIGKMTLEAITSHNKIDLLMKFTEARMLRYMSLSTFSTFGKGWTRRLFDTLNFCLQNK